MAAYRIYRDPLRAWILFITSYEKFDLYYRFGWQYFILANFDALKY